MKSLFAMIILISGVFSIAMIVDAVTNKNLKSNKVPWIIGMLFLGIIVSIPYALIHYKKKE